jgi:hypothetical protein
MEKTKICLPLEAREPNEVDKLNLRVKQIQQNCRHDFKLTKEPRLQESLVRGVIAWEKGPHTLAGFSGSLTLVCTKCSKEKGATITDICPRCLGKMKKDPATLGAGSRKKYFGKAYFYYSVILYRCQDCGLVVAAEEWDQ